MADLIPHLVTLVFLVLLQAVLGFDNLLYISLESKRAPADQQSRVRKFGIGLAIGARIVLMFALVSLIQYVQNPFLTLDTSWLHLDMNLHSVIVLVGGGFIMYTAVKEIWHMIDLEEHEHAADSSPKSVGAIITMIVLMNLVFSFDSILSAMALVEHEEVPGSRHEVITTAGMTVMATAIVISGIMMIVLADTVSEFLKKNRMYEVLGLFVLLIVGVMLLTEGGHLAHMKWFGHEIVPMSKATFYFVIAVLVLVDVVQSRYQRKLKQERAAADGHA